MLLFDQDAALAAWAGARLGIADFRPCTAIGVAHKGEIVAAAIYNNYRPPNMDRDNCATDDASNLIIKEGGGTGPRDDCAVEYVVETAGAKGPNYSAHMWCTDKSDPAKKASMTFIVIPRGDSMSVGTSFDDLKTYYRCPMKN